MIIKFETIVILVILGVMMLLGSSTAEPTSSIMGRVVDAGTTEPLSGVNVTLVGKDLGAATDLDGNYTILGVPPGTYIVRFSYIGYVIGGSLKIGTQTR